MNTNSFEWAIIGAGPAGIAAIGKLLDSNIAPEKILWIDPYFNVGDLGRYWKNVSSNTTVKLFLDFLKAVKSFAFDKAHHDFALTHLAQDETCTLNYIVEPLQWITDHFREKIANSQDFIKKLNRTNGQWRIQGASNYQAKQIILATGAEPKQLHHSDIETISFKDAINKNNLSKIVNQNETYAVFGSSHSAIMIIHHLMELNVHQVINFYRSPCRYAIDMGDWILFDNTGLKGKTAEWAKTNIDGIQPDNLKRYITNENNIIHYLPLCNKAIYAIGFEKRRTISIDDYEQPSYHSRLGIIAPGLFGLGIGYPAIKSDPFGNIEEQVGLWKFVIYLDKIMPLWLKYRI
ncbi:FAD-dependent oxidoreductase [Legionella israelensis]|uniref:Pyridine nucleotide-disulfide oxidoreductase n=1 Tax=Legionella israelensis TaxID=454 RepID=A0A0W0WNT8_9GAMM|nr:FAD-dependent oxidoreductase [Legionella israelensis]KTD33989.1 Pyridine nucleotide-disulfide oxidoreductase [Legionella israelensis]QBS10676.1 pyridine nucleotide-disulfide oxidoreductase [Legionella israelensis]SCX83965.1 Pyridine nucleotide-disulphide oxidoreductase [Legionella israelensis DSM 19235]STX57631.1 pyridine nucleotide-disulphide oxidoreductase [Legionella israelensis]